MPLAPDWSVASLRDAHQQLAQVAAKQKLRVIEPPLFALNANPVVDDRPAWTWQAMLPIQGRVVADELSEAVSVARTEGGSFLLATTTEGLPGLDRLYDFLFHEYLPRYKHVLTRPQLMHRAVDGIDSGDPKKLTIAVIVPIMLSLVRGELGPSAMVAGD